MVCESSGWVDLCWLWADLSCCILVYLTVVFFAEGFGVWVVMVCALDLLFSLGVLVCLLCVVVLCDADWL